MFKVENLDQINSLTYKPISKKNKYKYIIINKQYVDKKYEIGKRYKHDIVFYNNLFGLPSYTISKSENFKIMEIKLFGKTYYDIASDFKIVREINYLDLLDSDNVVENMISAIKNHEEIVLDAFLNSKEKIYLEVVINSGVYKYLDEIITEYINGKTKYEDMVSLIIREYGRNKDLDFFVNDDDSSLIQKEILNIGRPQDLNFLLKMFSNNLIVISGVCKNGRKKDMIYGLDLVKNKKRNDNEEENIFFGNIIDTGIDWILDDVMNNSEIKKRTYILMEIVKQGRKKDIDEIIRIKKMPLYLFQTIADIGFDEHLKMLKNHENSLISEYVSSYELPTI